MMRRYGPVPVDVVASDPPGYVWSTDGWVNEVIVGEPRRPDAVLGGVQHNMQPNIVTAICFNGNVAPGGWKRQ